MVDGKLVTGAPEAIFAARRQAIVPVIIGANDRTSALGSPTARTRFLRYSVQMLQRPANFTTRAADEAMGALASAYWVSFAQDRRSERWRADAMAAP
jgi:hypothetical protein